MRRTTKPPEERKPLLDLFPPITPYSTGFLDVDGGHSLYWEQSGNPDGVPILMLHGGPGAGVTPTHRRFFDPDHYRIIMFDQRGAGRSHPAARLENNTLPDLIADIESLRGHFLVERWHVFGTSWGSTLALTYAQARPQRCLSLIVGSIFLMQQSEIDWFLYGMRAIFPEAWEQFAEIIPADRQDDLLRAYVETLTGTDPVAQMDAAIRWNLYENACGSLLPNYMTITTPEQKRSALTMAQIEAHYFLHNVLPPDQGILSHIDKIRTIPATIVQGRYDVICPLQTAYALHQAWPEADYAVVPDSGHSALDPGMRSRLIEATENAKTLR